ncbi:hypothetical protein OSB04_022525 [Centaurea solstitialis]|uniref:Uncharacterized protein n=1 Tax=Centaurea solstitialis TaxID=347529 RepID=A0AA38W621_9ASTR|nr:hypothetical protein OSB04_022525 [Centaurea solstitialis]
MSSSDPFLHVAARNLSLPRLTVVLIFLSKLLAPTVRIHGASFDSRALKGPELPAEQLTKIPFCMAVNAAIANESR